MSGAISFGNNRLVSGGATSTQIEMVAGKASIMLIPENAVGNDISQCVMIRDTGSGSLYPIATATPPQEYDLPLADGWTKSRHCKYCKTQENLCLVNCSINGPAVIGSSCVATLPVGFRPKEIWAFPGHVYKSVERRTADVFVLPNGEIHVHADTDGSYVSFLCAFIASG